MAKWLSKLWFLISGKHTWSSTFDDACSKFQAGDLDGAEISFSAALTHAEKDNNDVRLFTTLVCMGSCLRAGGKLEKSRELLERAVALSPSKSPVDDVAYAHKELGICLYESGEPEIAKPPLRKAIELYISLGKQDEEEIADCNFFLARAHILQCAFEDAIEPLEKSLVIYQKNKQGRLLEIADTLHCQAVVWNRLGNHEKAEANLVLASPLHEELFGKVSREVARCDTERATAMISQGRLDESEVVLKKVTANLEELNAGSTVDYADALTAVATCCRLQRRLDEAIENFNAALKLYESVGSDPGDSSAVLTQLAVCYTEKEDCASAETFFRKALQITENVDNINPEILSDNLYNLAKCWVYQQRYGDAVVLYNRALALLEKTSGAEHPSLAPILTELAYCYQLQERTAEAKPLYQRALAIYENGKPEEDELADNLIGLANCYLEVGEYANARPLFQRALQYKQFKFDPRDQELASRIEDLLKQMEHAAV